MFLAQFSFVIISHWQIWNFGETEIRFWNREIYFYTVSFYIPLLDFINCASVYSKVKHFKTASGQQLVLRVCKTPFFLRQSLFFTKTFSQMLLRFIKNMRTKLMSKQIKSNQIKTKQHNTAKTQRILRHWC